VVGGLPGGADDLLVALVADQQDVEVGAGEALGFVVHLGDQRAGGVDGLQVALGGRRVHRGRDPVRGEHHDGSLGDLVGLLDEHRTGRGQGIDHMPVVHDFVTHVDGSAVFLQRALDGLDGSIHTRAVATRLGEEHALAGRIVGNRSRGTGNAHVDCRWHDIQGTWARQGALPAWR
jgi:hypothetical protein